MLRSDVRPIDLKGLFWYRDEWAYCFSRSGVSGLTYGLSGWSWVKVRTSEFLEITFEVYHKIYSERKHRQEVAQNLRSKSMV